MPTPTSLSNVNPPLSQHLRQRGLIAAMRISDTGSGMPAGLKMRIFDPFFTKKGVGKGPTFEIKLPLKQEAFAKVV